VKSAERKSESPSGSAPPIKAKKSVQFNKKADEEPSPPDIPTPNNSKSSKDANKSGKMRQLDHVLTDKFSDISEQEENESSDGTMANKSVEDDILKQTKGKGSLESRQNNSEMGTRKPAEGGEMGENGQGKKLKFRPVSKKNSSTLEVAAKAQDVGTPKGNGTPSRIRGPSGQGKESSSVLNRKNSGGHLSLNADSSKSKGSVSK